MKVKFLTAFQILIFSSVFFSFAEFYQGDIAYVSTGYGIEVYDEPDPESETSATIPFLEEIEILENSFIDVTFDGITSSWVKIRFAEIEGWCFSGFLESSTESIEKFMQRSWSFDGGKNIFNFKSDGTYSYGIHSASYGGSGIWTVSGNTLIIEGTVADNKYEESFYEKFNFLFMEDGTINIGEKFLYPLQSIRFFVGEKEITDDLFYYSKIYPYPLNRNQNLYRLNDGLFISWCEDSELTKPYPFIPKGETRALVLHAKFLDPSLETIEFPGVMKKVKKELFRQCGTIKAAVFDEGINEIEDSAFENCINLKAISLSSGLKVIGRYSFAGTQIESLVIPEGCHTVKQGAFLNCRKLKEISFPSTMEEIDLSVLCTTERKSNPVIVKIHSWNSMIVSDRTSSLETYLKNEKIIRPNIKAVYVPRGCVDRYKKNKALVELCTKILPLPE